MDQWATASVHERVPFQPNHRFSPYVHMERTRDPRYLPFNAQEINNYSGRDLMVWAGIMLDGRTSLHVFERGSVTGVRNKDEVLEPYVHFFMGACFPEFILMDNNARPHSALLVDEFLESEDIRRMDWSARSPDLNHIEYVWDALERAIATRIHPPRTIQEMKTVLLNEWGQLPQELINCLISNACLSEHSLGRKLQVLAPFGLGPLRTYGRSQLEKIILSGRRVETHNQ
ncbi:transposable element Tcb2 transposase [Trichonephila clavipes]|nr:transposable element Tcb2 transposase [Trichonephila clavipes]